MIIFKKFQLVVSMITQLVAYKLIAIDLNKLQKIDADSKAIQQISFTWNLDQDANTAMFFITEEVKETILDLSQETVTVL